MGTRIGELRESLMDAIERVKTGKMDPSEASAIAKLAAQISQSLQVEANVRSSAVPLGHLVLGHEETIVRPDPIKITRNISKDDD